MEIRLKLGKVSRQLMIAIPSQVVKDLKLKVGDDMLLIFKDFIIISGRKVSSNIHLLFNHPSTQLPHVCTGLFVDYSSNDKILLLI